MKLCKILGLNVKLKNDESKSSPIMTVKWEEKVLKCDKGVEVHLLRFGHGKKHTCVGYKLN